MISISSIVASSSGNVIFKENPDSDLNIKEARITRTATLDGGVYINHSGYTDGDRTLIIKASTKKVIGDLLKDIFELYTSVMIAIPGGIYLAAISTLNFNNGILNMTILIEQKET